MLPIGAHGPRRGPAKPNTAQISMRIQKISPSDTVILLTDLFTGFQSSPGGGGCKLKNQIARKADGLSQNMDLTAPGLAPTFSVSLPAQSMRLI